MFKQDFNENKENVMEKEQTKKATEAVVLTDKEVLSDEMLEAVAGGKRRPGFHFGVSDDNESCRSHCINSGRTTKVCAEECANQ